MSKTTSPAAVSLMPRESDEEEARKAPAPTTPPSNSLDGDNTANTGKDSKDVSSSSAKRVGKSPNNLIRGQFTSYYLDASKKTQWACIHCKKIIFTWRHGAFNASRANHHIQICASADDATKTELQGMTQKAKKLKFQEMALASAGSPPPPTSGSITKWTSPDHGKGGTAILADNSPGPKAGNMMGANKRDLETKKVSAATGSPQLVVAVDDQASFIHTILVPEIQATLARFEPLHRLLDPLVQHALVSARSTSSAASISRSDHMIPLLTYFPRTVESLYWDYVRTMDTDASKRLEEHMRNVLGQGTVSIVAVTATTAENDDSNAVVEKKKQKSYYLVFTFSKGACYHYEQSFPMGGCLESGAITDAEIQQCVQVLEKIANTYSTVITNLSHDDSTLPVLQKIVKQYEKAHPKAPRISLCRDPTRSLKCLMEWSAQVPCLAETITFAKEIIDFVTTAKVADILKNLQEKKEIPMFTPPLPTRRRNGPRSVLLKDVVQYMPVLSVVSQNDDFSAYLKSCCSSEQQQLLTAVLDKAKQPVQWLRVEFAQKWFDIWERAEDLALDVKFPLSAFLPLAQALRNELGLLVGEGGTVLEEVFGSHDDARTLMSMVTSNSFFNVDGDVTTTTASSDDHNHHSIVAPPTLPLLTKNQIWCHLVDPFRNQLRPQVWFDGHNGKSGVISDMLEFFVPDTTVDCSINSGSSSSSTLLLEARNQRSSLRLELTEFLTQSGKYSQCFDHDRLEDLDEEVVKKEQKKLRIVDVKEWIERTGGYASRLAFFGQVTPPGDLYKIVFEPLQSMRPVAPITSARIARALRRTNLHPEMKEVLLRVGLNLRFLLGSHQGVNTAFLSENKTELLDDS